MDKLTKKSVEYNCMFQSYSIPENERSNVISAVLIALQNKAFSNSFQDYGSNVECLDELVRACANQLQCWEVEDSKRKIILGHYESIKRYSTFASEKIKNKKGQEEDNTLLKDLIYDLKNSVVPAGSENDFDILGRFYTEFIRYASSDKRTGLVLTPSHITDFFCELAELQYEDVVYDPCCGTGGFLVAAMQYMMKDCEGDPKCKEKGWEKIKAKGLIGAEIRADMFTYACSNMLMRCDGKSNIYYGDYSQFAEEVKKKEPSVAFLNPPYDKGATDQLVFVEDALECLQRGGRCVAICQMSTVVSSDKKTIEMRKRLLEKHTLKAVFSMPNELFHPVGVITCILVFEAHNPHSVGKKSFFGYFKDDGHIKRKNKGRVDDGTWEAKKKKMLSLYKNKESKPGLSVVQEVQGDEEWCAEAYMETDYSTLTQEDFVKTIKEYVAFQFLQGDK